MPKGTPWTGIGRSEKHGRMTALQPSSVVGRSRRFVSPAADALGKTGCRAQVGEPLPAPRTVSTFGL